MKTFLRLFILWACVCPTVFLLNITVAEYIPEIGMFQRSALLSGLLVPLISLFLAPAVSKAASKLLRAR